MQALHARLGSPLENELRRKVVHIAGTNGKGSVAWKVARTLQSAGLRTGLFVSPHVSSFRERAQVNGELISEARVAALLAEIFAAMDAGPEPVRATFFEITTALALRHFAESGVDALVLEAGLGGRLDATNIVAAPALSVITSIALEHTRVLGGTVEAIAAEKAGIMKPGVPVVVGPRAPHALLRARARQVGAPFHAVTVAPAGGARAPAALDFEAENNLIAREAIRRIEPVFGPLAPHADAGLARAPPCRFEVLRRAGATVVLDVAHNPAALERLAERVALAYPGARARVVLGLSRDKDVAACLATIATFASRVHFAEAAHPRAMPAAELAAAARAAGLEPAAQRGADVADAVREALAAASASADDEVLVVCGTIFMMSDARKALGIDEPCDSAAIAEVAGAHLRNSQDNIGALP